MAIIDFHQRELLKRSEEQKAQVTRYCKEQEVARLRDSLKRSFMHFYERSYSGSDLRTIIFVRRVLRETSRYFHADDDRLNEMRIDLKTIHDSITKYLMKI